MSQSVRLPIAEPARIVPYFTSSNINMLHIGIGQHGPPSRWPPPWCKHQNNLTVYLPNAGGQATASLRIR